MGENRGGPEGIMLFYLQYEDPKPHFFYRIFHFIDIYKCGSCCLIIYTGYLAWVHNFASCMLHS